MANITYSPRNTPQATQGTIEAIKVSANTHGAPRSQVGMAPRTPQTPSVTQTNQTAGPEPIPQVQPSSEAPKSPTPAEDPQLSAKFAALARKEKAIRLRYQEIQQKEQEMVKLQADIEKERQFHQRLKTDPLDVLNEEGITFEQLVSRARAVVDPVQQEVLTLQSQVRALEEMLKRQQEESQKGQQIQREQALKQISMDVKELITSNPAYETVKDMGAEEAVTQLIATTYDEDGVLLTTDQAAKQVEEYLQAEALRVAGIPSIKKKLIPAPPPQAEQQQPTQATQKTMKTLSNTMGASEAPAKTWAEKKARIVAKYSKQSQG